MKHFNLLKNETLFGLTEWEYFVWRHRGSKNLIFHLISFTTSFTVLGIAIFYKNPWVLILFPLTQYIGFYGHRFEEGGVRSKDFFSPYTALYLFCIFLLIALRKYQKLIRRVEEKVQTYNKTKK